ncbi:AAA family ATPase [Sporolactobacillus kofuensis]|nr:AAA family ATPase [Sporolactobacillus kofuensis]
MEIAQFGRFTQNKIILPSSSFAIIYGKNEAGKSTVMQFILSLLFGFPQKKVLEKWKGKHQSGPFGGSLSFIADDGVTYRLDRSLGENPHLVSANGTPGDFHAFMRGMDQILYKNVFCFDLDGLRNIEQKTPTDLNDLLLGAGMIGSGALGKLEQMLEKNCGQLFKKSGKKPQINQLFADLNNCSADLKLWEQKLDTFQTLQENINTNKIHLAELENQEKNLQQQYHQWTSFSATKPLLLNLRAMESEMKDLENLPEFPLNGKENYVDLCKTERTLHDECTTLNDQIETLDESIRVIHVDAQWLEEEPALNQLFHQATVHEQNERERYRLKAELLEQRAQFETLVRQLGPKWSIESIRNASSSFSLSAELKEKLAVWKEKLKDCQDSERDIKRAKEKVHFLEKRMQEMRADSLTVGSRTTSRAQSPANHSSQRSFVFWTILVIAIALSISSAWLITPLTAIPVFLFGGVMAGGFLIFSRQGSGNSSSADQQEQRHLAEFSLIADQLTTEKMSIEAKSEQLKACAQLCKEREEKLHVWLGENGYAVDHLEWAEDIVHLVERAKEKDHRIALLMKQIQPLLQAHEAFEQESIRIAQKFGLTEGDVPYIEKCYHQAREKRNQRDDLLTKRVMLINQKERYTKRMIKLAEDKTHLLHLANVENEQQFYQAAEYAARAHELKKQIRECRSQLITLAGSETRLKALFSYLDDHKWEGNTEQAFKMRSAELKEKMRTIRAQLANDQASCDNMEENDSYRQTLDRYQALRTEANLTAKDWAVYQTAFWAIQKAKEQYRQHRLPRVMNEASQYFQMITDKRYESLQLDENGFSVRRSDGQNISAVELSRGTAEQLYLSLRLALMGMFGDYETFPLIIDDGFVNFDQDRSQKVYRILKEVAKKRQVILLTCHEHTFMHEHPEQVLVLNEQTNVQTNSSIIG